MKTESSITFYLRIVCVCILIALLGLAPAPHTASKFLVNAYRAISGKDYLQAASNLAGITRLYPWRADLGIAAGRYAFQAGDPKLAIQYLESPGAISHLSHDDLILLGDAYQQSGNAVMAEAIWKRVLELEQSIPTYQRLADLYLEQKDYSSAASYLQKLLSLQPSGGQAYYQIGLLYAVTEPAKALPFLAQAAQMDIAEGQWAQELHDKILTADLFDEPAYTSLVVGRQLADWGEWEWASVAFQQATTLRPDYADAWAFLGEARQQLFTQQTGRISDLGRLELELSIQLDPGSVLANTLMGLYWERQQDYALAGQYLQKAISLTPGDPYLYSELGNILSKAGNLPTAQAAFEQAIRLTPQDPLFYRQLAQFAMDNNIQLRELALPAARQALTLDPDDAASLDTMAQVMLRLLDYQSAERFARSALQSDPQFAPAYLHLGTAYLYQGEPTLAHKWLSRAQAIDPKSWAAAQASRLLDYYFPK